MKRKYALAAAVVLIVLAAAFWYGGDAPGLQGWSVQSSSPQQDTVSSAPPADIDASSPETGSVSAPPAPGDQDDSSSGDQAPLPDRPSPPPSASAPGTSAVPPSPEVPPVPAPPPPEQPDSCTISISCSSVLEHMDWLTPGKEEIIPSGGIILSQTELTPEADESVFSLLQRVTRDHGIPMEASFTPGTGSAYVEGIGNLYEFDCGQRSGWIYLVNGISPGYSCSEYLLQPGDTVSWVYTCDLGQDVGASAAGG